eukprot:5755175-Prymnesium_polylepis.1
MASLSDPLACSKAASSFLLFLQRTSAWLAQVLKTLCFLGLWVCVLTGYEDEGRERGTRVCVLPVYGAADANRARVRGREHDAHSVCYESTGTADAHRRVTGLRGRRTRTGTRA